MKRKTVITICLFAVAFAFISIGVALKNPHTVVVKAINICLECIGIG